MPNYAADDVAEIARRWKEIQQQEREAVERAQKEPEATAPEEPKKDDSTSGTYGYFGMTDGSSTKNSKEKWDEFMSSGQDLQSAWDKFYAEHVYIGGLDYTLVSGTCVLSSTLSPSDRP